MKPYDWQLPLVDAVVRSLTKDRVFISGFPTGSGKTVISLAAAKLTGGPHLVVAPKVSLTQWRRVAEAMGVADQLVDVINPEKISTPRGCRYYTRGAKWSLPDGTTVIWDEPHRSASGVDGITTQALADLKAYSSIRLHAMSATLADSPLKLRALGWWTGLHEYNAGSFYSWCRANGCRTVTIGWGANERQVFQFTRDPDESKEIMTRIRQSMGEKFMAMRAEDIPGFPTQTLDTILLDLSSRDTAEIRRAYEEMSMRMKTTALDDRAELGRACQRAEFVMAEAVAELAAGYEEDGNSPVVFFSYTEARERFEATLTKRGLRFANIYGGQKELTRQQGIDAFQRNDIHVMSVMTQAGGASLSLHDVLKQRPRISLILPSWNASTVKQCLGRILRCEGTHAAQYFVLAAGTVQEKVAQTLKRKMNNIDSFNDAITDDDLTP
ncbi:MAG: helicase-related protein [Patescibacteria group bacterium]